MTDSEEQVRVQAARAALSSSKEQYEDLIRTWTQLEGKAQGVGATAGIFLAATFGFVRTRAGFETTVMQCGLFLAILLLVGSVVLALLALWIRKIPTPPYGVQTLNLAEDLLAMKTEHILAHWPNFSFDQARWWNGVNKRISEANERKARWVWSAQLLLGLSIGIVAVLTLALLVSSSTGVVP